jgi:SAM-dependent methyltransferase
MNKILTQDEYWDKAAGEKEFTTPFKIDLFEKYVPKDAQILDIGCGYGRTLNKLYLSEFINLAGIDISEKMIDKGSALHPDLNLNKVDKSGILPFEDNSFDAVILLAVLTCVIDDVEQAQLISEVYRVLSKDGIVYINDFIINNDQRNIDRYEAGLLKYNNYGIFELQEKKGVALRHYSEDRIAQLTERFKEIVFKPVVYTTMNKNKSNGFYYMGRK